MLFQKFFGFIGYACVGIFFPLTQFFFYWGGKVFLLPAEKLIFS